MPTNPVAAPNPVKNMYSPLDRAGVFSLYTSPAGASLPVKNIYLKKVEYLFAETGAEAAKNLTLDMIAVIGADTAFAIATFLSTKGCNAEAIAVLKETCALFKDRLDIHEHLGKRLSSSLTKVGLPIAAAADTTPANACEFVTVMGPSHTRSFASGTRFLPLMLGAGAALTFLTPETAEATKRITWSAINRADPKSLILLIFGNADVNIHLDNRAGTATAVAQGVYADDAAVIRQAASRYFEMVDDIRSKTKLNLVLLSPIPPIVDKAVALDKVFNEELTKYAKASGVPLMDLTKEFADPITGKLREDLRGRVDDPHMGHNAVPVFEAGLERMGLLPKESLPFDWDYMFRFSINPDVETRIWSEPHMGGKNVVKSTKIQFAQILQRAGHIITGYLSGDCNSDVLVLNGREGFLSFELPPSLVRRITSVDHQATKALMANRVRRLLGRTDIEFTTTPRLCDAVTESDYTILVMHEDDDVDECLEAISAALNMTRQRVLVLSARNIGPALHAMPQVAAASQLNLSNRLVTGYWSGATLFVLTPAQ